MHSNNCNCHKSKGKAEKFIQPCILLLLMKEDNYGYILLEKIKEFGFYDKTPDVSVLYRNLNKLEKEGYVKARWATDEPGPAKKIYTITEEGREYLSSFVEFFEERKRLFDKFIGIYKETI